MCGGAIIADLIARNRGSGAGRRVPCGSDFWPNVSFLSKPAPADGLESKQSQLASDESTPQKRPQLPHGTVSRPHLDYPIKSR